jgi:hypothetical protein
VIRLGEKMSNPFELAERAMCATWYRDSRSRAIVVIVPRSIDWVKQECSTRYLLAEMKSGAGVTSTHSFQYIRDHLREVKKPQDGDRISITELERFTEAHFGENYQDCHSCDPNDPRGITA